MYGKGEPRNMLPLSAVGQSGASASIPRPKGHEEHEIRVSVYSNASLAPGVSCAWALPRGTQNVVVFTEGAGIVLDRMVWPREADLVVGNLNLAAQTAWWEYEVIP